MTRFQSILLMVCLAIASTSAGAGEKRPIPSGAKLSLHFEKDVHFLGENVLVHLCVENTAPMPFTIDLGGDYRGSPRHLRFKVLAIDEQGKDVPDPDPNPMCMGGLGYSKEIKQDEKHFETFQLLRYRRFEKPGTYRLRVTHDFGWKEADDSKRPAAVATIKFVMPDEKQARKIVEEMSRLPKDNGGSSGERRKPFSDFSTLIYPVYLPILAERARTGDARALEAIGHMPTPEATKELIGLLTHRNRGFARQALKTLNRRLPDPALENKLGPRHPFEFDYLYQRRWLVGQSWKPEFASDVRKVERELLAKKDVENIECGAYVLQCLGTGEDMPLLAKALGEAAVQAKQMKREQDRYPRPRGACQELVRAASVLVQRSAPVADKPTSAGELILFACAIGGRERFRPKGWEGVLAQALQHDLPYVREMALMTLPLPPPAVVGKLIPALVEDSDVDVQIAACHVAEKWKAAPLRESVLRTLRLATEDWLFNAANNAAVALGARMERVAILVARLDEPGMTARCLKELTCLIADTEGHGSRTDLDIETGWTCKKAWLKFLEQNGDAIGAGKKFKLADPRFPTAELYPQFTFYPRR